jgi:hypothetical protein
MPLNQPRAELAEDGLVKAGIPQVEAETVFPIETAAHGVCRLPVYQAFPELPHRHQSQAPRGLCWLARGGEQSGELLIGVEGA